MVKDMSEVLQIIEVATTQRSGEQYPTMALVLPLVYGLRSQLAESDDDRKLVADFKATLREQLTQRFSLDQLKATSLPVLCTALDPRFRRMAFLSPADHEEVKQEIIDQASRNGADHQEAGYH